MSLAAIICPFTFGVLWILGSNVEACDLRKKACPYGMVDDGANCWKHTYGRGTGRAPYITRCPSYLRDDGTSCWSDAHIYSKKCCCTIWGCCRGQCRSGYDDDGCTCRKRDWGIKKTYFQRLRCRSNEDLYGSLCYPKCKSGYKAVGCCLCEPEGGPGIKLTLFQRYLLAQMECKIEETAKKIKAEMLGRN